MIEFSIQAQVLAKAVEGLLKADQTVSVSLEGDGLKMWAGGDELYCETVLPVQRGLISDDGSFALVGDTLKGLLKTISGEVTVTAEGEKVSMAWGSGSFATAPVEVASPIAKQKASAETTVEREPFLKALSYCRSFCTKDSMKVNGRECLLGIDLDFDGKTLNTVATDLQSLGRVEIPAEASTAGNAVIPTSALGPLSSCLQGEKVAIGVTEKYVSFSDGNSLVCIPRVEGNYPNWRSVDTQGCAAKVTAERKSLLAVLGVMGAVSAGSSENKVSMTRSSSGLLFEGRYTDTQSDAKYELACEVEGEFPQRITVTLAKLQGIISGLSQSENTVISVTGANSMMRMEPEGNSSYTGLLMPVVRK